MNKESQKMSYAFGELLFIFLPFLVMAIIYFYKNKINTILYEPEWSLAASVMFGQSIIKFIHILTKKRAGKTMTVKTYNLGAGLSAIMVLGLVPTLISLSLIFTSELVPDWLMITQIILFVLATIVFSAINMLQIDIEEEEEEKIERQ
jgi:hypothetical protein